MCEYCDGKEKKLPIGFVNNELYGTCSGYIFKQAETGMWFIATAGEKTNINIPLKYCPYCGRYLLENK